MKQTTITLFAALLCLSLLAGCNNSSQTVPPATIRPVQTMSVPDVSRERLRVFSGVARSAIETGLSFRVPGEIITLPVTIGQEVRQGDIIARLDATDYALSVGQLEASLAQVQARLTQAAAEYGRIRTLYEADSVSRSDYDQALAGYDSLRAQQDSTAQNLALARKQLDYCTLHAPAAGRIGAVPVEVHETVNAGVPVATLTTAQLEMEIGVPEALINQITVGSPATIHFDALPGTTFTATVSEVGVTITSATTYPVKLEISASDGRIRSGMVGEASLRLKPRTEETFVTVPAVAVFSREDGKHFVWTFDPSSEMVLRRQVSIGDFTDHGLQIYSGLEPGEIIVTRGVHHLQDGQQVRLLNPSD